MNGLLWLLLLYYCHGSRVTLHRINEDLIRYAKRRQEKKKLNHARRLDATQKIEERVERNKHKNQCENLLMGELVGEGRYMVYPPDNHLDIHFAISIQRIMDFDINLGVLTFSATIQTSWADPRLIYDFICPGDWDSQSDFLQLAVSQIDQDGEGFFIWTPSKLFARESLNEPLNEQMALTYPLEIYDRDHFLRTGWNVLHQQTRNVKVYCSTYTKFFPVDRQSCRLRLVQYGSDSSSITLIPRVFMPLKEHTHRRVLGTLLNEQSSYRGLHLDPLVSMSVRGSNRLLSSSYAAIREYSLDYSYVPPNPRCERTWKLVPNTFTELTSGIVMFISLQRISRYYLNNVLIQLQYVIIVSVCIQWLPFYLYDRASSLMAVLLILVTVVSVHSGTKTYLEQATHIDNFVAFSYVTVLLPIIETAVITRLRFVFDLNSTKKMVVWQEKSHRWYSELSLAALLIEEWEEYINVVDIEPHIISVEPQLSRESLLLPVCHVSALESEIDTEMEMASSNENEERDVYRTAKLICELVENPELYPIESLFEPVTQGELVALNLDYNEMMSSQSESSRIGALPTGLNRELLVSTLNELNKESNYIESSGVLGTILGYTGMNTMSYPSAMLHDDTHDPLKFMQFCETLEEAVLEGSEMSDARDEFVDALRRDATLEFASATSWASASIDELIKTPVPSSPFAHIIKGAQSLLSSRSNSLLNSPKRGRDVNDNREDDTTDMKRLLARATSREEQVDDPPSNPDDRPVGPMMPSWSLKGGRLSYEGGIKPYMRKVVSHRIERLQSKYTEDLNHYSEDTAVDSSVVLAQNVYPAARRASQLCMRLTLPQRAQETERDKRLVLRDSYKSFLSLNRHGESCEDSQIHPMVPKCIQWAHFILKMRDERCPAKSKIVDHLLLPVQLDNYWQLIYGSIVLTMLLKFDIDFNNNIYEGLGQFNKMAIFILLLLMTITMSRVANRYIEHNRMKDAVFSAINKHVLV